MAFVLTGAATARADEGTASAPSRRRYPAPRSFRQRWVLKFDFEGAASEVCPEGRDRTSAVVSWFRGSREDWKAAIPAFASVAYTNLWPGVDLVYTGEAGLLKATYLLQPGADVASIKILCRGAEDVRITEDGRLRIATPFAGIDEEKPYAYQDIDGERREVCAAYELRAGDHADEFVYGFRLGEYDSTRPLVLDPAVISYCGYIGGSEEEQGMAIAVDGAGCAYVTGNTFSTETTFPDNGGPDVTANGGVDAFVAKVSADGTSLVYCGFIGGSYDDYGNGIAVDDSGNAYIVGSTASETNESDFPAHDGPGLTYGGGYADAFVAKVNAAGTALTYSGYIGGAGDDYGQGIAIDDAGNAYVTGRVDSSQVDFPVTVGPDLTLGGPGDAFVAKVSSSGTSLAYCGFLGGDGAEQGFGIAVDGSGNAYVVGATTSDANTFPCGTGPALTYNGNTDAFVAKVSSNGASLEYCGYVGGSGDDQGFGITVDGAGCAYLTGQTASSATTFPEATGPDLTQNGEYDAFVAKVNSGGTALAYCGYIGGEGNDYGQGIAVDDAGNAYVMGYTGSPETSFPATGGPDLTYNGGDYDTFAAKVNPSGTGFVYCGYLGGANNEYGFGVAVDGSGAAYVAGYTSSTAASFPVAAGPDLTFNSSGSTSDAFVGKLRYAATGGICITSTSHGNVTASSLSWTHTVGDESNRLLLVGVAIRNGGNQTVSGVTWDGTSLTQVPSGAVTNGTNVRAEMWYLVAPALGAGKTITVTLSGSANVAAGAITFAGVHQTTPFDSCASATGSSTSPSVSGVTSATADVVVDVLAAQGTPTVTPGSGQTQAWTDENTDVRGAGDTKEGAATVTMSATLATSQPWAIGAISINPANATAVRLSSFEADEEEGGVLLQWRTGFETDNLGFHIWREREGASERITTAPVAGSAILFGRGSLGHAHHAYRFFDADGTTSDRYWLEDVELSGARTLHGPAVPAVGPLPKEAPKETVSSPMSSEPVRGSMRAVQPHASRPTREAEREDDATAVQTSRRAEMPPDADSKRVETQLGLAAGAAVKLSIREEGWYRVGQPELIAAGLDGDVDPRCLGLYVDGREVPMRVESRSAHRFVPGDFVEFYGVGLDTLWTDARVYWLAPGRSRGARIASLPAPRRGGEHPSSFPFTIEHRPRSAYFASLRNGDASNFFGEMLWADPVELSLCVRHLDPASPAGGVLGVALQGVTLQEHRVRVFLNANEVGTVDFEGQARAASDFAIPGHLLREGENLVTLARQESELDVSFVDSVRITYAHTYRADADALRCTAPGRAEVTVRGFSDPGIRVLDVTDPDRVRELTGPVTRDLEGFSVRVAIPGTATLDLFVFVDGRAKSPAAIAANRPSRWCAAASRSAIAMISHRTFLESLAPLKRLREREGYEVALVDVEDLYDELSFGAKSPNALKSFLRQGAPALKYALLVGDAGVDPRNFLGRGDVDFVPTMLVDTTFMETAADEWCGDFDGDWVPEVCVGRLPVRTPEEAEAVVAKIVGCASGDTDAAWTRRALLIADANDAFDFEQRVSALRPLFPTDWHVRELFLGRTDPQAGREELLARLNEGQAFVGYFGHGSVEIWSSHGGIASRDARGLTNGERLPFVVAMTCLNGFFHDVYSESLAEALLKQGAGGAAAVWACSGLTHPEGQALMYRALLEALFSGERRPLGDVVREAKAAVGDRELRQTWLLFGDPAARIR